MKSCSVQIDVSLTVTDSLLGDGNGGGGRYNYRFDPDLIHVKERDTEIVYRLAEDDHPRFRIVNLYSTDVREQLGKPDIGTDGATLTIVHRNSFQQLTVVSLLVHDTKHDQPINCDPQVTNDPPPVHS